MEYIEQKAEYDKRKAVANQKRYIETGLDSQLYRGVHRAYKAQKRMKGK
jgi:hypothetical protein